MWRFPNLTIDHWNSVDNFEPNPFLLCLACHRIRCLTYSLNSRKEGFYWILKITNQECFLHHWTMKKMSCSEVSGDVPRMAMALGSVRILLSRNDWDASDPVGCAWGCKRVSYLLITSKQANQRERNTLSCVWYIVTRDIGIGKIWSRRLDP